MTEAGIVGTVRLANGTHDRPERDMALEVVLGALEEAGVDPHAVDGLYTPQPRPWAEQGFFSTLLSERLGADPARRLEAYTGGTSAGVAFQTAVSDVRDGRVETAVVAAVERNSTVDTADYFEYVLGIFDREFESPAGPTVPGLYAMSLQRYCAEFGADREDVAAVAAKNRTNGTANPEAAVDRAVSAPEVLDSRPIAEPLRRLECPAPCDTAAALVVTADPDGEAPVQVTGTGAGHADSHLLGPRGGSLARFPAVGAAGAEALSDAGVPVESVDVFEPYAPFPHVEAILTEELGLFDPGEGAAAAADGVTARDGEHPVSPSGGCLGRGHPAMVTPLLNYADSVAQLCGTAPTGMQVSGARRALTTSEHGHVDGATATVLEVQP